MSTGKTKTGRGKPTAERRMQWVLNLEKVEATNPYAAEFEVASEGLVNGLFNYGNNSILCGALDFSPDQSGLYYYLLKLKTVDISNSDRDEFGKNASQKGYVFPDGIVGELLTLFSLYFRRRFYLVASYFGELTDHSVRARFMIPFVRVPCLPALHPDVFSKDQQDWSGPVHLFMDSVKNLDERYHPRFILAAYHYAKALRYIGIETEMVFIRLVSAVEILSSEDRSLHQMEGGLGGLHDLLLKDCLSDKQKVELKALLSTEKAKAKFIRFIEDYAERHCQLLEQGSLSKIGSKGLRSRLGAIYDARSEYLHAGQPMYLSHPQSVFTDWDMEPSVGMTMGRRLFRESQKLPYISWFERIVRDCLLGFLEEHRRPDSPI